MSNNQQPGWPQQPNQQQPQPQPQHGGGYPPVPQAPGQEGQTQQFPPYTPQPGQDGQQTQQFPPYTPQPGQEGQTQQFPPYTQQGQPGQYGDPGQQYGNPYRQQGSPMYPQPAQKKGMPVWGWVASGAGALAVIAVAGVMVFSGLSGGKQPIVAPDPTATESAASEESAAPAETADINYVSLFEETDFDSAPVWSVEAPEGWASEAIQEGTMKYTNADLQCTFTTHQAILPPTGETEEKAATELAMAGEINGVKQSVEGVVDVREKINVFVKFRDDSGLIELQETELRFKNKNNADVVYLLAVRATPSSDGLMELGLVCPGGMTGASTLWNELIERVTMTDAP